MRETPSCPILSFFEKARLGEFAQAAQFAEVQFFGDEFGGTPFDRLSEFLRFRRQHLFK